MDTTKQSTTKRVVMLPWLARGHMTPFLELAKQLTSRNFHIYLTSTPINLSSIQNRIPISHHSPSIDLIPLHLPPTPELPPNRHTTNGLPPRLVNALREAFETASPSFSEILRRVGPDLVIYDFLQPWAPAIAAEHGIPAVQFITSGAVVPSFFLHRFKKPGVDFPFPAIQPIFRVSPNPQPSEAPVKIIPVQEGIKKSCRIILFNTFRELEGKYIDYLPNLIEKKIVPVGPLVQEIVSEDTETSEILQWLGTKDKVSTVFVSFGSESFLSEEEREEVARGLELSGVNFIWVLRFPVGERIEVEEALPKGFSDRVRDRGLVVEDWAPQPQILAHPSTGGFVSHCGWNSILESLKFGVPIIAMPMNHDQPINAQLVVEVGVGVEVKRDDENGRLNREEIAQVIRKVVVEKNGEDFRTRAREFSEIIRMKGEEEIDWVVEELVQICNEGKSLGKN